jgi:hypothetical protein
MTILDVAPPQEPNAAGSFESLRLAVHQHAARAVEMTAPQPGGHIGIRNTINVIVARAEMVEEELEAANATTPADVESRRRQLVEIRDLGRAHLELLAALQNTCGAICLPGSG